MFHKNFLERAFTIMEITIVISIVAILAAATFAGSMKDSFKKGRDSKRKQDLNKLMRVLEDYYNDKEAYPNYSEDGTINGIAWGSAFPPYVPALPKDPLTGQGSNYYYLTDPNDNRVYAIYAKLEFTKDPDIEGTGCKDGCGPGGSYNFVVHSPNTVMIGGNLQTTTFTPSVTPTSPPAPTPTNVPGTCGHLQCCPNDWCGAFSFPPGWQCSSNGVCYYNTNQSRWECGDPVLLGVPCP